MASTATSTATSTAPTARPTLTDIDSKLLRYILAQEARQFQETSTPVGGARKPLNANAGQGNSLLVKIAASLLRHGKNVQEIYDFFEQLIPRCYKTKLVCPVETDFKVVSSHHTSGYSGSSTPEVTNKESNKHLHPQEWEIYYWALLAAQHPVLATTDDSLGIAAHLPGKQSDPSDATDGSLSPASKECMSYRRGPIRRSSIFEIEPEDLTELVRQAFCLTHGRHDYYMGEYLKENERKSAKNDPAKVLVEEIRELELIYDHECHPYYNVDLFRRREEYERWLQMEKVDLADIIRDQEKYIKAEVKCYPNEPPLTYKDKHPCVKVLLNKLFRAESMSYRINEGTKQAIPKKPLSEMAWRLLNEFGKRYRIRSLYLKVCLFDYLVSNFDSECKVWYMKYVATVLEAIFMERKGLVTKDEIRIVKAAMQHLSMHVKNFLTRINRVFPRNMPEGGLQEVIGLLKLLVTVDEDDTFGEHNGITVDHYLKMYVKQEMQTKYDNRKMVLSVGLKVRPFDQQLTPPLVSLMILDISQEIHNYRMYFKDEFIGYFDIVEMAVEVFYELLMKDVVELCGIHPVNQHHQNIDYLMIALADRLTSFDHEPAWKNYLSFEGQIWRPSFLKHSYAWMSSLHGKLHGLICSVLEKENWQGLHTDHTPSIDSVDSRVLHQSTKRSRPRQIFSPLTSSPLLTSAVTPSHNSAFAPVGGRSASIEREVSRNAAQRSPVMSDIKSTSGAVTAGQPSCSNVEATKDRSDGDPAKTAHVKIPKKYTSSGKLTHGQSTKILGTSVTSESADSVYTDAKSDIDDYVSCSDGENDQASETDHPDYTTIPISSSLIDTISGINRLINVVRHFSQLLCPKKSIISRNHSLRMSPEDPNEIRSKLEQGRINMAAKLGETILSLAGFYGYYVIGCESCGMSDEVLKPIIGQRCLTRSLSLIQENGIRPCRHRAVGLERCNRANSNGSCIPSCAPMSQIETTAAQSERVVEEMCVRLNNVRTIKTLLSTLVEAAVQSVLTPGPGTEFYEMAVSDMSNPWPSTSKGDDEPSTSTSSAVPNVVDKHSIEKTVDELQEIEDGLVKLMAYRANDVVKKVLDLLLSLNLRSFNSRKRLRPVLNVARKTVHTLAVNLYPDCYAAALRHFWLAIVQDFAEEKENLLYLIGTAKDRANLLLDAISYFIEIFRAEEDSVSLAFVSKTIEPVLQTLNFYTLPTRTLIQMYEALQQRNTSTVRITDTLSSRYRYQRKPSNVFIGRVRIELLSEHAQHFSGRRFVECVSDRIRSEGNLGLGICAVPNGCDADSGNALGQYLLDNDMLCYVGRAVKETADRDSDSDNNVDDDLGRFAGVFIPVPRGRQIDINEHSIFSDSLGTEGQSSMSEANDGTIINQEDATVSSRFIDSDNALYRFNESPELDESLSSNHSEYHSDQDDNSNETSLVTVLFTRRNIDENAKHFLDTTLHGNAVVEDLNRRLRYSASKCSCWPSAAVDN